MTVLLNSCRRCQDYDVAVENHYLFLSTDKIIANVIVVVIVIVAFDLVVPGY